MLDAVRGVWRRVLGEPDLDALDELFARVVWIADGELDALDRAAREYRAIIGPAEPPPSNGAEGGHGQDAGPGGSTEGLGAGEDTSAGEGSPPPAGSLGKALQQALQSAAEGQLEQLDEDVELQEVLEQAAGAGERAAGRARACGTGLPTGRMPDRDVDRPPAPDEIQHARRYATRLRQALTHGTRRIDKRHPAGRFDGRAYTRAQAQRAMGRPVTSHPWQITRQVRAPIEEPHVGLVIDTSGSMGAYEYALGPICWILTDGLRQIGGRCATALFGNSAALLSDGTRPLALVPRASGPAAAPRSPATRSNSSQTSSR